MLYRIDTGWGTTTPSSHQSINSISNHHNQQYNQLLNQWCKGSVRGHGRPWTSAQRPQDSVGLQNRSGVAPPPHSLRLPPSLLPSFAWTPLLDL